MLSVSRYSAALVLLASSLSPVDAYGPKEPQLNVNDPRFTNFKPPGKGDLRSACPGLNSLANHGFLPHNGRKMNATDITLACFYGLGMSPETCTIITLSGLDAAKKPASLVFDLPAVDLASWAIEHDVSMSRKDRAEGDFVSFNKEIWDNSLAEMNKCGSMVDAMCLGRVKVARLLDEERRNPKTKYDKLSAGHGAVESGRLLLTMGNGTVAPAKYIRSIFEQERLPYHLGWRPKAYTASVFEVIQVAGERYVTRLGIHLYAYVPLFACVKQSMVIEAGFRRDSIFSSLRALSAELEKDYGKDEKPIPIPN